MPHYHPQDFCLGDVVGLLRVELCYDSGRLFSRHPAQTCIHPTQSELLFGCLMSVAQYSFEVRSESDPSLL